MGFWEVCPIFVRFSGWKAPNTNYTFFASGIMGQSTTTIRIGGVPEHFNMPWHWCIEQGLFAEQGINAKWTDFPGGTGAMTRALRANDQDIVIALTEGTVTDIINGNPSKIVKFYVDTPLIWGVHVPAHSSIQQVADLKTKPFAISRVGSGSHLMASIMGQDLNWQKEDLQFEIVGNLDGARKAMAEGEAFGFLWEKFTTQPYVDNGEFRRVGEVPTPWPCFAIAVRNEFYEQHAEKVTALLDTLNQVCSTWKQQENIVERIAQRYQLKPTGIEQWLSITEWNSEPFIESIRIKKVLSSLYENNLIDRIPLSLEEVIQPSILK